MATDINLHILDSYFRWQCTPDVLMIPYKDNLLIKNALIDRSIEYMMNSPPQKKHDFIHIETASAMPNIIFKPLLHSVVLENYV